MFPLQLNSSAGYHDWQLKALLSVFVSHKKHANSCNGGRDASSYFHFGAVRVMLGA